MSRFLSWISSTFGAASLILVVLSCAAGGRSARATGPTGSRSCTIFSAACETCSGGDGYCGRFNGVEVCEHTGQGADRTCSGEECVCGWKFQTCQCG
jgi:hypothetical protein